MRVTLRSRHSSHAATTETGATKDWLLSRSDRVERVSTPVEDLTGRRGDEPQFVAASWRAGVRRPATGATGPRASRRRMANDERRCASGPKDRGGLPPSLTTEPRATRTSAAPVVPPAREEGCPTRVGGGSEWNKKEPPRQSGAAVHLQGVPARPARLAPRTRLSRRFRQPVSCECPPPCSAARRLPSGAPAASMGPSRGWPGASGAGSCRPAPPHSPASG